ncbi:MAG: hypothetical protein RIT28_366 [Pseudomonadota bacterium]
MAEPFKEWFNPSVVRALGERQHALDPRFPLERFVAEATDGLAALELKGRVTHIAEALRRALPAEWPAAVERLLAAAPAALDGEEAVGQHVAMWPLLHVVEVHGLGDPARSLAALGELTRRFSAEFAVRPYLHHHPGLAWAAMHRWAVSDDVHQRRLASEGARPRLPWGGRVPALITDPGPGLAVLERLKDDPALYVRKSVANHLNDVTKDHPERALAVARIWLHGASDDRRWVVRHALRMLVKQGQPEALALLGFEAPKVRLTALSLSAAEAWIGDTLTLSATLEGDVSQALVIDYALQTPGARPERPSEKVFKGLTATINPGEPLALRLNHKLREVTTRTLRPGPARISLLVSGERVGGADFTLRAPG